LPWLTITTNSLAAHDTPTLLKGIVSGYLNARNLDGNNRGVGFWLGIFSLRAKFGTHT